MPKTQTTSPTTARLQRNLPRRSAIWAQQCSRPRPHRHQSGGIARHEGSTRRRHAARRLRVVQNPHHHRHGGHQGYGGPGHSACERQKPGNRTQGQCQFRYKALPAHPPSPHIRYKTLPAHPFSPHGGTKLSQHEPHGPTSGTKLSQHEPHGPTSGTKLSQHEPHGPTSGTKLSVLTRNGSIWRFFYMQGEFYTVLTTKKPSRESNVPFSPPRGRAGQTVYRTRGRDQASQHNNTPGPTGVKRAEGAGAPRRGAGGRQQDHSQTNFAHNFPRSLFETTRKRCNPNEAISRFEQVARELRAKLLNIPGTTAMKSAAGAGGSGCGARGRRWGLVRHIPARQMPPVWRVPASPEGQAAVPVGGGGAWPDNESTRRAKLAARTASGRAATHGCIKQPGPAGQARGADGSRAGRRPRRSQAPWPGPTAPGSGCAPASAPLGHCPHHLGPRHAGRTRAHLGLSGAVEP